MTSRGGSSRPLAIGAWLGWRIVADELYAEIFAILLKGVGVTAFVTLTAFSLASLLGLALAAAVLSRFSWLRQLARFWIEVVRGIPMLVLLFYIAFVGAPLLVTGINAVLEPLGLDPIRTRDIPLIWRAILALTIGYSAFIAEVFRAGIEAVGTGQVEAAKSARAVAVAPLPRLIVFPQALRTILPPLGNDFIAMIKDSRRWSRCSAWPTSPSSARSTRPAPSASWRTYNVVAYVYLLVTLLLSLALRRLEARLGRTEHP